jgi:serine/threonine-protein kinase
MTPERWKQISRIYEDARLHAASDRAAFLAEACAGDPSLQREVQALLDQPTSPKGLEGLTPSAIAQAIGNADNGGLTGRRFGVYLVGERIGVGGMGEVYRARDTRLGRDVAIKVLPQAFATDADRLARFEREARVLASLDHPHIGAILGVEESDGVRALVLGLVEGDTLAERIARGPIPLAEALEYARQIANALEAAHEKGIVHRDLKPGNIKITPAGVVKVLDFGLAKAEQLSASEVLDVTVKATASGIVLGTVAYMSPEQARGHAVDKRADIWAFGCVLYEMLTGRDAFARLTPSDTVAAILDRDPDLRALPTNTPPGIERLLKRCFEKDPKRRLRDIGEARVQIDDAQRGPTVADDGPRPVFRWWLAATLMGVVLLGVATAAFLVWTRGRPPAASASSPLQFFVGVTPADAFGPAPSRSNGIVPPPTRTDVALSPDGTLLVFSGRTGGRQQLYLRQMNRLASVPIAGTENSNSPVFSPDGQWLGFWTGRVDAGEIGELKKLRLDGGPAVTLAKVPPLRGATWGSDEIVFAHVEGEGRLWRVPAAGGMPEALTTHDSNDRRNHSLPHMLPDGRSVLYTISTPNPFQGQTAVLSLSTGETHVVLDRGVDARYVPSGHLVYVIDRTLMAVPFDLKALRVTGTPTAIVEGVIQAVRTGFFSVFETGAAQFSVSETGTLVYVPGDPIQEQSRSLVWISRNGTVTPTTVPPGPYGGPRLSPDGQSVVMHMMNAGGLVVHDLARGGLTQLTTNNVIWSTWTPDGKQITVTGPEGFASMSIDRGVTERFTVEAPNVVNRPGSWSPDGHTLLFTKFGGNGRWEIRALSRTGADHRVLPAGDMPINERYPQFSPDGKWFVYTSNESGRDEVWVERFPGPPERHQVSTDGGIAPVWAPNGGELFYAKELGGGPVRMMSVDIKLEPAFSAGRPRMLFEHTWAPGTPHRNYDVSPDGRFLMLLEQERPPHQRLSKWCWCSTGSRS